MGENIPIKELLKINRKNRRIVIKIFLTCMRFLVLS